MNQNVSTVVTKNRLMIIQSKDIANLMFQTYRVKNTDVK